MSCLVDLPIHVNGDTTRTEDSRSGGQAMGVDACGVRTDPTQRQNSIKTSNLPERFDGRPPVLHRGTADTIYAITRLAFTGPRWFGPDAHV